MMRIPQILKHRFIQNDQVRCCMVEDKYGKHCLNFGEMEVTRKTHLETQKEINQHGHDECFPHN